MNQSLNERAVEYGFGVWGLGEPFEEQKRFLFSEKRNVMFCAGRGTGKTTIGVLKLLLLAMDRRCAGKSLALLAPTYRQLSQIHEVMLSDFLENFERHSGWSLLKNRRRSDKTWTLINDCRIHAISFDRAEKIRGLSLAGCLVDEIESAPDPDYTMGIIAAAVRSTGDAPLSIFLTTTPKGFRGQVRVYLQKIRENPTGDFQMITCPTSANPHLPPEFLQRLKATLSKAMWAQECEGKILRPSSTVYPEFSRNRHVVPFVYTDEPNTPYDIAIDWGYSNCSALWCANITGEGETDRTVVFDEIIGTDTPEQVFVDMIKKKCAALGRDPDLIVGDRAIPRQNQAMMRAFRSSRVRTLETKNEMAVWRGVETTRGQLDPVGSASPRLFFSSSLLREGHEKGIIRSMESLRRKVRDGEVTDEIHKDNVHDHACDAIRMLMVARFKNAGAAYNVGTEPAYYADRRPGRN
tara:strand:+ start:273 stop:1667 length:1395 start_codon:yes stop_codon:yes gene_type:complete